MHCSSKTTKTNFSRILGKTVVVGDLLGSFVQIRSVEVKLRRLSLFGQVAERASDTS